MRGRAERAKHRGELLAHLIPRLAARKGIRLTDRSVRLASAPTHGQRHERASRSTARPSTSAGAFSLWVWAPGEHQPGLRVLTGLRCTSCSPAIAYVYEQATDIHALQTGVGGSYAAITLTSGEVIGSSRLVADGTYGWIGRECCE